MSDPQSEAVFVNVTDVEPSRYEELLGILKEGNSSVIRRRDGFVSALIVASADRTRVITVARWKSLEAIKAIQNDPVILEYVKRTAAVAKASPAVFTVVAEYRP
jgi:heme-degrading monooxygenase HmoA